MTWDELMTRALATEHGQEEIALVRYGRVWHAALGQYASHVLHGEVSADFVGVVESGEHPSAMEAFAAAVAKAESKAR